MTGTERSQKIFTIEDFAEITDYSLMNTLNRDPDANVDGDDHLPRQVFSGHYVPVKPTPIGHVEYVAHSTTLFSELGFDDSFATTDAFAKVFSGDLSDVPSPMHTFGWATGYALSIYGTEYTHQCPFQTGNGYGDGRAISIVEVVANNQRWEMQLKGAGRTPFCRGADGRAVLRSSVREFLAQEFMHALGVPTSRSLCLFASKSEFVDRPWYSEDANTENPDIMVSNPVAISTRVAPSFLRVGQLELFSRRARSNAYPTALTELEMIVQHLIDREYAEEIAPQLSMTDKVLSLAEAYCKRLTSLVTHWLRVGYCQGNFNSDNCAGGGFTLDYGPFGFCEKFDPVFQPWTGGGQHFSFLNQPFAAEKNFGSFCSALEPLLQDKPEALTQLQNIRASFPVIMQQSMDEMWASKLGLESVTSDDVIGLLKLMAQSSVDYTLFFRELSYLPNAFSGLEKSFYTLPKGNLLTQWQSWFNDWHASVEQQGDKAAISAQMKQVNPKYTWREWLVVPAYERAANGDYALIHELQQVFIQPYEEQTPEIEAKYYRLKPDEYFNMGGVSHYSCSS